MGIDPKYVKFLRSYTSKNEVLKAAQKRQEKEGAKLGKSGLREQILKYAEDVLQKDEAAVRSALCVRKKA
jgi:Mg2+ and Co2+ transporter CorA